MERLVPRFILEQHARGARHGRVRAACLFADIAGFTELNRALAQRGRDGAEQLASALRFYFDPAVSAVEQAGGFVATFAGDAFQALFPAGDGLSEEGACRQAAAAAGMMQEFFRRRRIYECPHGRHAFQLKVGISAGEIEWGVLPCGTSGAPSRAPALRGSVPGEVERFLHYFRGAPVDASAAAGGAAAPGEVVVDATAAAHLEARRLRPGDGGARLLHPPPLFVAQDRGRDDGAGLDGSPFLAPGVAEMPPEGEFRHCATVFLAFDRERSLEELARRAVELATELGGTTGRLDHGDKGSYLLFLFGATRAYEDDPERAAAFAVRAVEELAGPARLRAGLGFGLQYAGYNGASFRAEFTTLGPDTNLAARLMASAAWGEVWCAGAARERLARSFRDEPRGAVHFKGFAAPLHVAALLGRRAAPRRDPADEKMLGRDEELARLLDLGGRVLGGSSGALVHIRGEAGMGKSLLGDRVVERLGEERGSCSFWHVRAPGDRTVPTPWHPFRSALIDDLLLSAPPAPEALDEGIGRLQGALPRRDPLREELARARPRLATILGLAGGDDGGAVDAGARLRHENSIHAIVTWLRARARASPGVLRVEDVPWWDESSRAALDTLLGRLGELRILVVADSRSGEDGERSQLAVSAGIPSLSIELAALAPRDVARLGASILGAAVSGPLRDVVAGRSHGNPMYAVELFRHLRAEGAVDARDGRLHARASESIPDSLDALLIARLDALGSRTAEVVRHASVLGQEFSVASLARMLGSPLDTISALLAEAAAAGIVVAGGSRTRFRHALLRDAAYQMQARARRVELHRRAAEALAMEHPGTSCELDAILAEHWDRADRPEEAARHHLSAARWAAGRYARASAEASYRRYLELAPEPGEDRVRARVELACNVLQLHGRLADAESELRLVLAEPHPSGGSPPLRGSEVTGIDRLGRVRNRALRQLGEIVALRGRPGEAQALLEQALAAERAAGHREGECAALGTLGTLHGYQGRMGEAGLLIREAMRIAIEVGDRHSEAVAVNRLGSLRARQLRWREARALFLRSAELFSALGNPLGEGSVIGNLGFLHHDAGLFEEARRYYTRALAIHRKVGNRRAEANVLVYLAQLDGQTGRSRSARRRSREVVRLSGEIGASSGLATCLANLALLAINEGKPAQARRAAEEALAVCRDVGDRLQEATIHGHLATMARERGDLAAARERLDAGFAILREIPDRATEAFLKAELAAWELVAGDPARVEGLLDGADELLRQAGDRKGSVRVHCVRGHLALSRGRGAAGHLRRARRALGKAAGAEGHAVALLEQALARRAAGVALVRAPSRRRRG